LHVLSFFASYKAAISCGSLKTRAEHGSISNYSILSNQANVNMIQDHLQNDQDGDSDAQAFLAGASSAEAAGSHKDCAATPNSLLSRRVTFSDDHIVHQMPGAPSSAGWESEGGRQKQQQQQQEQQQC
jgi:hypothetical protein